jgi:S1-C subfamily serine protease
MERNLFDDDHDSWSNEPKRDLWGSEEVEEQSSRALNFKFKVNPKMLGLLGAAVIGIATLASVLPDVIGGDNPSPTPTPSASTTSTPTADVVDLYSQPKMLQSFIDNALASAVTIYCGNYSGSGWAIDLSDDLSSAKDDRYSTEIVTNNHVIEGCESSGVTIVPMGTQEEYDALVYSYDRGNDLAILITDHYLPPLATVQPGNEAKVGQWVMAVGSPGAGDTTLDGSITTGAVTNLKEGVVITDTTINPGNSGGPLINAAGQVIAVVSAKIVDDAVDSIGIARNVSLICEQLKGCTDKQLLK